MAPLVDELTTSVCPLDGGISRRDLGAAGGVEVVVIGGACVVEGDAEPLFAM